MTSKLPLTPDDTTLEAMLRNDAAVWRDQYIDNEQFSQRVMQQIESLPARTSAKRRVFVISGAVALGCATVFFANNGVDLVIDATMDLATYTITPAVVGLAICMVSAIAIAVGVVASEN